MLYLFTGTNEHKARTKAFAWIEATRKKEPSVSYVRLSPEQITPEALQEITLTQGLFFTKILVLLDDPFGNAVTAEIFLDSIEELAASSNPIAVLAPSLTATQEKKIAKYVEKTFREDTLSKKPTRGFNGALVNALAAKKGKVLWIELMKAKREGDAPEMLHGLLHWKARDIMQKNASGWTNEEARALSVELIELVAVSRSGDLPLAESLERFALGL